MKKIASLIIIFSFLLFSASTFAQNRRGHDHIGNFNFKVQVDSVTKKIVKLKTVKLQNLTCPSKKEAKSFYEGWPVKWLKALKSADTIVITSGEKTLKFSGVNSAQFFKADKVVTFKFKTCK